jgi:NAD(P)-dependent dehydrogenase (short-subunit alcohol dehydrogenase family)
MHALVASPFKSAYNAAKHGIAGFTKTVALEMAQKNITCNAICPGYVLTGGLAAGVICLLVDDACLRGDECLHCCQQLWLFVLVVFCAYNAAKHGIAGFTKTVALEMAQKNTKCNATCPGYVLTGGSAAGVLYCDVLSSRCYVFAALLAAATTVVSTISAACYACKTTLLGQPSRVTSSALALF